MNRDEINNVLQMLNSISRMAVLEGAFTTEKMLSLYNQSLKYRFLEEGKDVVLDKEVQQLLKCCELSALKRQQLFSYDYERSCDIKATFIPHYALLGCMKGLVGVFETYQKPIHMAIRVFKEQEQVCVTFQAEGDIDFAKVIELVKLQKDYDGFAKSSERWRNAFGKEALEVVPNAPRILKIKFASS